MRHGELLTHPLEDVARADDDQWRVGQQQVVTNNHWQAAWTPAAFSPTIPTPPVTVTLLRLFVQQFARKNDTDSRSASSCFHLNRLSLFFLFPRFGKSGRGYCIPTPPFSSFSLCHTPSPQSFKPPVLLLHAPPGDTGSAAAEHGQAEADDRIARVLHRGDEGERSQLLPPGERIVATKPSCLQVPN